MNRTEYLAHAEIAADATGQKQIEALRWMRDTSARALACLPVPEVERPASGTTMNATHISVTKATRSCRIGKIWASASYAVLNWLASR